MKKKVIFLIIFIFAASSIAYAAAAINAPYSGITLEEFFDSAKTPEVEAILSGMTLDEKVGQMFMGCFYSKEPSPKIIEKYHLGSVLLFGETFKTNTKKSLRKKLALLSAASEYTPIVAVDEEGGSVVRVSGNAAFRKKPFKSPRELFKKGGLNAVLQDTHEKNALLTSVGIHLNLAPVCDISKDPDDFMYDRSLGQDAKTTAEYAARITQACLEDHMACALKHFPGYGNSADTHKGLAMDKRSLSIIKKNDLLPFKAGIESGAPMVLVSHNIVTAIDDRRPSSMSPASHRILRDELKFRGVIITDDLSMGAISNYMSSEDTAVNAVMAGNDMLCTGDYKKQYSAILKAIKDGIIPESRIDSSVRRIIRLKMQLGLINPEDFI